MEIELTLEQSINVIDQALNVATSKGAFTLKDASLVNKSLESLKSKLIPAKSDEDVVEDHTEEQVTE